MDERARDRPTVGSAVSGVSFKRSCLSDFDSEVEIRRRSSHIFPPPTAGLYVVRSIH